MADYVSVHQLMLQSVACVPIRAREPRRSSARSTSRRASARPARFADELPTLVAFADQVAIAIETARLVGENERRAGELEKRRTQELEAAQAKLEELLGHRTEQLAATRRDLRSARAVLRSHFGYEGLVGTSAAMRRVYALIDRVKDTDVPVLITGESGTGKEIVARAIHNAGPRAKKPFVGVNCGAIPEHLLESELFGHVRGAFTGADRDRKGLFREATEGTILLDEIGEMPQKMQAGLLRVLQEKVVRPVGGAREEPVDARVIAATHRDLARDGRGRDASARTSSIASTSSRCASRRCASGSRTSRSSSITSSASSRRATAASGAASRAQRAEAAHGVRLAGQRAPARERAPERVGPQSTSPSSSPRTSSSRTPRRRGPRGAPVACARRARAGRGVRTRRRSTRTRPASGSASSPRSGSCNWNRVKAAQLVGMPRRTFYRRLKEYGIQ